MEPVQRQASLQQRKIHRLKGVAAKECPCKPIRTADTSEPYVRTREPPALQVITYEPETKKTPKTKPPTCQHTKQNTPTWTVTKQQPTDKQVSIKLDSVSKSLLIAQGGICEY